MSGVAPASRPARPRVLFVLFSNPAGFPPVERAATILRDNGCAVRILGTRGLVTDALDPHRLRGIDIRLVPGTGTGIVHKLRLLRFTLSALLHVLRWRPAWLYASDALATPAALLVSLLGTRVVYHEHDAPSEEAGGAFGRAIRFVRRRVLRRVPLVVTPNAGRAARLRELGAGDRTLVVWNCPARSETRPHAPPAVGAPLRLLFQGSIVPARLPLAIVDAMARARCAVHLEVIGYETQGAQGHVRALQARATDLGIGERVTSLGPMPHEQMLERTARADLGLALMPLEGGDFNERNMAGASNKAFEYLACGVPLLTSDLPDWRALYGERGLALACDPGSAQSIADALDRACADREALAAMGARGRELIETEWNYETAFAPVLRRLLGAPERVGEGGSAPRSGRRSP